METNTISRGLGKTKPHLFKVPPTAWAGSSEWTWACEGFTERTAVGYAKQTGYGVSMEHAYAVWDDSHAAAEKVWKKA
jgi:hypothetical protein